MKIPKTKFLVFILVLLLIGGPVVVNILFKWETDLYCLHAEWTPDALLGYLGTLIGAAATILAVVWTIFYSMEQQQNAEKLRREDRILQAKPWLTSSTFLINSKDDLLKAANEVSFFLYKEKNSPSSFAGETTIPQQLKQGNIEYNQDFCIIRYELSNVGGNSATNLSMNMDDCPLIPNFAMATGAHRTFIFILPLKENEVVSEYILTFSYGDTVSTSKYVQREKLLIQKDEYGVTFAQKKDDLLSEPKMEK